MAEGNGDRGLPQQIDRVMVGTDRSRTAERAVRWAADFAGRFDAEIHVVQVIVPDNPVATEYGAAERTRAAAAQDELRAYVQQLAGTRGHAVVVVDEDPAMAIVKAASDAAVDVLVVGNAGMAGRKEFLLGNVPNRIIAQRHLHGDHREHDRQRRPHRRAPGDVPGRRPRRRRGP